MPRLIIERPGAPPRLYELKDGSTIHIGRAASNDITLPHSSISRRHALLEGNHDVWIVRDQRSANGVLVNGVRIEHAELKSGDVIGLGDIKLRFENMMSGTVVAKTSPELASHLTQILDQESVAKLLERSKNQPTSELTDSRVGTNGEIEYLKRENRLLTLLYQVSRALGDKTTVEDVTECVLDLVLQIDGAERGYAMLLTEESLGAAPHAAAGYTFLPAILRYRRAPKTATPQMALSRAIIQRKGGEQGAAPGDGRKGRRAILRQPKHGHFGHAIRDVRAAGEPRSAVRLAVRRQSFQAGDFSAGGSGSFRGHRGASGAGDRPSYCEK